MKSVFNIILIIAGLTLVGYFGLDILALPGPLKVNAPQEAASSMAIIFVETVDTEIILYENKAIIKLLDKNLEFEFSSSLYTDFIEAQESIDTLRLKVDNVEESGLKVSSLDVCLEYELSFDTQFKELIGIQCSNERLE